MNIDSLINTLETANFTPNLVASGTELTITCPLCWDDKPRLYISTVSGLWYCFKCNRKGNLLSFLTDICDLDYSTAFIASQLIKEKEEYNLPIIKKRKDPISSLTDAVCLPTDFMNINKRVFTNKLVSPGLRYLEERGINEELAKQYGIGYCITGPYSYRVIVPVYTEGELKTFVARSWLKSPLKKVLMPPGSTASQALFNYDSPRNALQETILVEGVFDALKLIPTVPNVIATLGAHITTEQRLLLKRKGDTNVILLRDGDKAGLEASIKEARLLKAAMMNVKIAILPEGKDPNSATLEEVYKALDNAKLIEKDYGVESLREVLHGN